MDVAVLANEYGAKNLRFFIPMSKLEMAGIIPGIAFRNSNSPREVVECTVDEFRYKVLDGYKITLRAVNPAYGTQHFYISDLDTIMETNPGTHRVYVLTIDGYQRLK